MEISLNWIDELLDLQTIDLEALIEKLIISGFEVEKRTECEKGFRTQTTLDISATANRSDSLSIRGISCEIGALLNQPLRDIKYNTKILNWHTEFEKSTLSLPKNDECQAFLAITLKNLTNVSSPKWLQQKLLNSGLIPENNVYDFQAYVQLETGYPFEFYDLEKILLNVNTQDFGLRLSKNQDSPSIFVNNIAIGIAGVGPINTTKCSKSTSSILLEGSIFKAAKIRQRSRYLGIRTNRSIRYEKSIKEFNLTEACYRLISLLRIKNPNLSCKLHTNSKIQPPQSSIIRLHYNTVKKILGPLKKRKLNQLQFISPQQVETYLIRLDLKPKYNPTTKTWSVDIPSRRNNDIVEEIDLIEEIGRVHGFNDFQTQLPFSNHMGVYDASFRTRKKLTRSFLSLGLTEFVHYSLTSTPKQSLNMVRLINPLLAEYSELRTSLLPNLIQTLANNINQGNLAIEGFEYGHIFFKKPSGSLVEKEVVSGLLSSLKTKSTWDSPSRLMTWFEAKGRLEQVFETLNLVISWKSYTPKHSLSILHPYKTSQLFLANNNNQIGVFGQINPIFAKKFHVPASLYLFELDFDRIKVETLKTIIVTSRNYSFYPKIIKDLSIVVFHKIGFETLRNTLYLNGSKFLIEVTLLDEYKGPPIPDFHISLCLQLVFQSNKQTLENRDVEKIIENLKLILIDKFHVIIRD